MRTMDRRRSAGGGSGRTVAERSAQHSEPPVPSSVLYAKKKKEKKNEHTGRRSNASARTRFCSILGNSRCSRSAPSRSQLALLSRAFGCGTTFASGACGSARLCRCIRPIALPFSSPLFFLFTYFLPRISLLPPRGRNTSRRFPFPFLGEERRLSSRYRAHFAGCSPPRGVGASARGT